VLWVNVAPARFPISERVALQQSLEANVADVPILLQMD
jgi:hypothetical protein